MKKKHEHLYDQDIIDAFKKLTEGLKLIESDYEDIFEKTPFSRYYLITFPPQTKLKFLERFESLPIEIRERTEALCKKFEIEFK